MTELLWQHCLFRDEQEENNIKTEKLKICFDNIVHELNILKDRDDCTQFTDDIVTNPLNINAYQLNETIILEHPLIFILRDLAIELLQKKNIIFIKLITLFTKFYSKINDTNLSKLQVVFFHQPLFDVLVHHRLNEEFSDIINQFLINLICVHKNQYHVYGLMDQTGPYLDEVVTYLCSSAYINTFNHLFTRLAQSDQSELDGVEKFYLITCPHYACYSGGNYCYMHVSVLVLEKMFQFYLNILIEFTKIIKNYSQIIIKPVTSLMALLQCISFSHELRQRFTNVSQNLIGPMWTIIYELSLQQESHTDALLIYTIIQMFYATFESELLPKIKQIDMIPTLLKLLNNGKTEDIQFESCRLLAVIMTIDDIQNRLTNATKIVKMFVEDFYRRTLRPFYKIRLENNLFCLKNLVQNNEIKMELVRLRGLQFLISCITDKKSRFVSMTIRQRVLQILFDLITNKKIFALLKQDHLFLFHVKNLLLSSSEQGLQQAAIAIVQKLETEENLINVPKKQGRSMNTSDDLTNTNNYDILISYSPDDKDICYQIRDQLVDDNFGVKFGLDSRGESTIKSNVDVIGYSKMVLLCISDSYAESAHCQLEAQYAFKQQYCIIPVIVKYSYRPVQWLQTILTDKIFIDFSKFEFKYAYEKLKTEIIQQRSQLKRNLNQSTEEAQFQKTELTASSDLTSMDQKLLSTSEICPVSIHAFLGALDEWYLLKSVPVSEETFVLIWFDPNIENVDRTSNRLCKINDFIRYYIDLEQCVTVIQSISESKIVLVTAVEVAQKLLPQVTPFRCIDSIFIYSNNSENVQFKPEDYPKVVGVFSDFNRLAFAMKNTVAELDKHLQMQRSFNKCKSQKEVIYEFGDFLWFHVFIETAQILYGSIGKNHDYFEHTKLVDVARIYYRDNSSILEKINDFKINYRPENALQWYTVSNFPYELLNKALRTEDFELLTPFLFFILDLKKSLVRDYYNVTDETTMSSILFVPRMRTSLARKHYNLIEEKTIILYRGLNISLQELEKIKHMKGELISMNGFLSTTRSRSVAEMFSGAGNNRDGNAAVIFEIECDATILEDNFIFADVSKYSRFPDEEEVLIDIGAVFRVKNIIQDLDGNWIIHVIASAEVISIAKKYAEDYQWPLLATEDHRKLFRFHSLLSDRFHYEKAQEHLEQLLDKPNGEVVATVYVAMTRVEELNEEHEILVRDHYDYTRERLSKGDFKQFARTLNKIGFFLPRNEQLRKCPEILKFLNVNEDLPDKAIEMENFTSVLPQIGDAYRKAEALWKAMHEIKMLVGNRQEIYLHLSRLQVQCIDNGRFEEAQIYQRLASDIFKDDRDDENPNFIPMETLSDGLSAEPTMGPPSR